jgi:RNA polymerase sigma factor (sigma-70 family)
MFHGELLICNTGFNQYAMDVNEETEQLIRQCLDGNRQAQNRLYNQLMPKMFLVCLRYSENHGEAEEILQEGFTRMFECIRQYNYTGPFEGWVRKIMINCALQKYKIKKQTRHLVTLDPNVIEEIGREDIVSQLQKKELLKMVQKLSPGYRSIFNLYVLEGMKHREIAEYLGISEGTSKSNLSDARAFLQKEICKDRW